MLMQISIRGLQNYIIKTFENDELASVVDYLAQKLLISNTTLMSFIPPQVRKMTTKLRHNCGYEICIITKDIQVDFN